MIGARTMGASARALELSLAFAQDRRQFGRPIVGFQAIEFMLADMAAEIMAAKSLLYRVCWEASRGDADRKQTHAMASAVKLVCSETAGRVIDKAVQIFGGRGTCGSSGRAHVSGTARRSHLGGHQRDPAGRDRQRAPEARFRPLHGLVRRGVRSRSSPRKGSHPGPQRLDGASRARSPPKSSLDPVDRADVQTSTEYVQTASEVVPAVRRARRSPGQREPPHIVAASSGGGSSAREVDIGDHPTARPHNLRSVGHAPPPATMRSRSRTSLPHEPYTTRCWAGWRDGPASTMCHACATRARSCIDSTRRCATRTPSSPGRASAAWSSVCSGNSSRSSPTAGTTGRVRRPWAACATCRRRRAGAGFLRVDMLDSVEQALGSIGVGG